MEKDIVHRVNQDDLQSDQDSIQKGSESFL